MVTESAGVTFAERVQVARIAARLSQAELAERCGEAEDTIRDIERGRRLPTDEQLARLRAVLALA